MRRSAALLAVVVVIGGCEDPFSLESGYVEVYNHTDRRIKVYFEPPEEEEWFVSDTVEIGPGRRRTIEVESEFWDADLLVVYCGQVKKYDVDLGILGHDEVHVRTSHFPRCEPTATEPSPEGEPVETCGIEEPQAAPRRDEM